MVLSAKVNAQDLRSAERLSRLPFGFLQSLISEHHVWLLAYCAICLTGANLIGMIHESWMVVLEVDVLIAAIFGARHLWIEYKLRRKARRLNLTQHELELTVQGVIFRHKDGTKQLVSWSEFPEARANDRLLIVYHREANRMKRKRYFIVPLHALHPSQRNEQLLMLPDRLRSNTIQRMLKQWRLA